jgi:RNA polymerase sigma factor (sigma-70 family)
MVAPDQETVTQALEAVLRNDRGRLTAALIARVQDFQLAEDALQEAAASALVHWTRTGVPDRPDAWLVRVAFRKAIDRLRRVKRDDAGTAAMAVLARDEAEEDAEMIADERLRLIFTCCHPALEQKSSVALTLRVIAGLSTAQIARAFLDAEPTMGQRLSRAKAKIGAARIPFVVPGPEDWPDRLNAVLAVTYLIFNAGYSTGPLDGRDLCDEAIFLARLLDQLRPGEAEVEGALALLLITHARRAARIGSDGATVPPREQPRSLWDQQMLTEGIGLLDRAVLRRSPGPYQIKAAIAALHSSQAATDWAQIAMLYGRLAQMQPTPVVRLNQAVAMAEAGMPDGAMELLNVLSSELAGYQPYHAARAELLFRLGQIPESLTEYDAAIAGAASPADAAFLIKRRAIAAI